MAKILSGKEMSEQLIQEQAVRVAQLHEQGIFPGLAVVLVGEDPASQIYVRNKGIACEKIGIHSQTIRMAEDCSQEELLDTIQKLNNDPKISGILVQLPLPKHLNEEEVLSTILPEKDVDGFHLMNVGKLSTGQTGVVPCTPKGVLYMLKQAGIDLKGKEAVIIGRSNIVGKPAATLLLNEHCTVTICHSRTQNLAEHTRRADILVAAIGKPNFVTADMVKPGAVVIDVGINRLDGKVVGDVAYEDVEKVAGWITPVPGGVGKMTISMLMENTLEAACAQAR
ncbi:MAG: bifunctional methylenetetrahydrofolate dehydrogenase/methenyltetrahydrofolate cyclohydrolase FolD [Clostridiales bacterium]|jgi:methylenetetrahydrofolate dehydrogenase (NADP+)/methenyltetrahydrofolate cyclohydrolase|nr:bifunctional methylenetetrahydrofolate dehydrogenase/methenyltetrahydrofolate cyclohydrolase FolD [Clostridiales bacterium]